MGENWLQGPFNAMLRSPTIADWFQKIGAYIRFTSPIPAGLKELAIIVVARYWSSDFEWPSTAGSRGLWRFQAAIEAIEAGRRPPVKGDEATVFDFIIALLTTGFVSDSIFDAIKSRFGEAGASELIALAGYYTTVWTLPERRPGRTARRGAASSRIDREGLFARA